MAAQCATEVDDNPLWNFALQFYASKDVQELLLTLQDDYQQDTLLLLTALWLANEGQSWQLTSEQLDDYHQWRANVIWSLRAARKAIAKDNTSPEQLTLRQQIQKDEIRAEQIALHQLYSLHSESKHKANHAQLAYKNLMIQAELAEATLIKADIKKEALGPLFQQLADLLVSQ
ncbi:TIGR02444 family protein [Bacterioplanoides sp.]|uniref:TIGR02444 family protein n=1 Tax=Bacterioplanoides sp. TaxID=2066072 RepID=UPI003B001636